MKKDRIFACIFVLMLSAWIVGMFSCSAQAQTTDLGTCGENLIWSLDGEGTLTISGVGAMTDYDNNSFAPWYKYCSIIKRVIIENGVTCIGSFAFYNCPNLSSLTVGASVENVGSNAFRYCYKLAEVINKSSLDICAGSDDFGYIGAYAIEVHTGESKLVQQGDYLFYSSGAGYLVNYLGSEAELALPSDCNGSATYAIWHYAFYGNTDIASIVIPKGVTFVGKYAFAYCNNLASVTMGEGLVEISDYAFACDKKLTSITFAGGQSLRIGSCAFYDCDGLVSIDLPFGTSSIGSGAFCSCAKLEHISIGDAATSIGSEAFKYCTHLKSIKIGPNITSIGSNAFESCIGLKIVYINSQAIAAALTSASACGNLIKAAEVILVDKSISDVADFVSNKFEFSEELNYKGTDLVSFSLHAHIWRDYSVEPVQCKEAGFAGAKCTECLLIKGNVTSAHSYTVCAGFDAEYHWDVCEDCGEIANQAGHTPNKVAPTCTDAVICENCNQTIKQSLGHEYGAEWTVDLDPTCTEEGSKSHHCSRCEEKADVTAIAKSAHTYGDIWYFDGEHHFKECTCGDTFAQAHTWNAGEVTKQATKEAEGETTYTCTVCAKTKTESIPKLPSLSTIAIVGIAAGATVVVSASTFSLFWFAIKKKRWIDLIKVFKK